MTKRHRGENYDLRIALDAPDGFLSGKHREMIERVRHTHPHTVVYRELIDESTCVTYAFTLFRDRVYRAVASNFGGEIFAGRRFMEWLIQHHLEEIGRPVLGCIATYSCKGVWQHVGIVSGAGRVTSQWGTFPVYEHGVFEVPARYGDEVRYFKTLPRGGAVRLFLDFSKTCGSSDADISRVIRDA
ncbi:MAG: hypothetical protein WD795_13830 [Woeseia sp.]